MKDKFTVLANYAPHGFGPMIVAVAEIRRIMKEAGLGINEYRIVMPLVNSRMLEYPDLGKVSITEKIFMKDQPFSDTEIYFDEKLGAIIDELNFKGNCDYGDRLSRIANEHSRVQEAVNRHMSYEMRLRKMASGEEISFHPDEAGFIFGHNPAVCMLADKGIPQYFSTIAPFSRLIEHTEQEIREGRLKPDYAIPSPAQLIAIGKQIEATQKAIFTATPSTLTCMGHENNPLSNEVIVPPFKDAATAPEGITAEGAYITRSGIGQNVPYLLEAMNDILAHLRANGMAIYSADTKPDEIYAKETACAHLKIRLIVGRLGLSTVYNAHIHGKPMVSFGYQPKDDIEMHFNERTFCELGTLFSYNKNLEGMLGQMDRIAANVQAVYKAVEERFGTLSGDSVIASHVAKELKALHLI